MVARRVPLRRRDLFWITHNCSPERTPRRRTWCPPAGFRRENKFRISQLVSAIVLLRSFDAGGSQLGDARLNVRTLGSLPAFGPNDGSRGVVERIAASNRRSTVLLGRPADRQGFSTRQSPDSRRFPDARDNLHQRRSKRASQQDHMCQDQALSRGTRSARLPRPRARKCQRVARPSAKTYHFNFRNSDWPAFSTAFAKLLIGNTVHNSRFP
jgi:hypothetical protein